MQFQLLEYYELGQKNYFKYVYQPHNDSFMMLALLHKELKAFQPQSVLQIGCGSGFIVVHLAKWLQGQAFCVGTDINIDACLVTCQFSVMHKADVEVINCDCTGPLNKNFDLIVINPPYVPTQQKQLDSFLHKIKQKKKISMRQEYRIGEGDNLIDLSYAGGNHGIEVTKRMFQSALKLLSQKGRLYIFLIKQNQISELEKECQKRGLQMQLKQRRRRPDEQQLIYLISR